MLPGQAGAEKISSKYFAIRSRNENLAGGAGSSVSTCSWVY